MRGRWRKWRKLKGPASIQSDRPMPTETPFIYFEVTILKGRERDDEEGDESEPHEIRIGFAEKYSSNAFFPGDVFDSFGYSDGTFHAHQHIETVKEGRRFLQGDVIGCGLAMTSRQLVFTHNGHLDGVVECEEATEHPMYAKVGLRGDVKVKANFGQEAFHFDVETFLKVGKVV